ncbi:hypothetical protein FJY84_08245, partial [Candidatus Bathyarchaeota archaeon]|nr:hypothetical protein [Candidatus Bathyarchaeota archaeon]
MQELQKRRKVQVPSDIFRNLSLKQAFYLAIPGDVSLDQQEEIEIVDVPPEFQDSLIAIILKVTRFKTLEEMLANLGNK